jgi:hypothetical protein
LVLLAPWLGNGNQANNREKGSGTWLVTGGQASDRELDRVAWLDKITQSRNHCSSDYRAESARFAAADDADLAALREMVQQLTAGQDQTTREIAKLEFAVVEILMKIPEPPPQPPAAARKPAPVPPPSSRAPTAQPSLRPPPQ